MVKKYIMEHPTTKELKDVIPNTLTWHELRHKGFVKVAETIIING